MINVLNAVAVTLLIAVISVFPAALLGQYVPGVLEPVLRPIAVAAWLSGLISWFVARAVSRNEQEAAKRLSSSSLRGVAFTVVFLALAVGVVAALHFFGDGLL